MARLLDAHQAQPVNKPHIYKQLVTTVRVEKSTHPSLSEMISKRPADSLHVERKRVCR
jgi:hypothetical protein